MNIVPMILAAGKGTRMKSSLPKVLHKAAGLPMLSHVLNACEDLSANKPVVVIGHGADLVRETYGDNLLYALQEQQLGTGHAVMMGFSHIPQDADGVLVVCGDTPLLRQATLQQMAAWFQQTQAACVLLTAHTDHPKGYGRILRDDQGLIQAIVEEKDATDAQRAITEINTGTYLFAKDALEEALSHLSCDNAQGEYYLTDVIAYLVAQGANVQPLVAADFIETLGVNDQKNLAFAAHILYQRKIEELMADGVTFIDPATTYIDVTVQVGQGTLVEPNCYLRGSTTIGEDCLIGMGSDITDSIIGSGVTIKHSVVWEASLAAGCTIGPFAYLRPGAVLEERVKVGDFSEIKKSHIGAGSKVPHLSYIGDATVGSQVNIGCGTITCNYDGYGKHQTAIGDHVFIGSNTNLVAPVRIGEGALVAAGSTIVQDIPAHALGIARGKQEVREYWAAKRRQRKEAEKAAKP